MPPPSAKRHLNSKDIKNAGGTRQHNKYQCLQHFAAGQPGCCQEEMEMKITIDDREIEVREGQSILKAALEAGVFIPHLCSHPDLEAKGGCRLCSVEIEGMAEAVPSCLTEVKEGMKIHIHGEKSDKIRKDAMELILATHPAECTGCPKFGKCELQSLYQYLGVSPDRWRKKSRALPNDDSNPLISHLFTRCIRCGRCIRACHDLRGVGVLDYIKTDVGIHAGVPEGKQLKEADCRFCGACIEVCPTGSIMDQIKIMQDTRVYADNVVPCRGACPAHIDIPRYIRYIKAGDFSKAAAVVREKVPFPEVLGSVCSHVCENQCKRGDLGDPISICKLKRAAAVHDDGTWKKRVRKAADTGKKAAVVGAGPAGLTAALYLAKKGHRVSVFEKNPQAGGQLRYGIPGYRLPDAVIEKEVEEIVQAGVQLYLKQGVESPQELLSQGYDVLLFATGTHAGVKLPIEGRDLLGVYVNTEFLKDAREKGALPMGDRVVVLGGGNVAYDCARTALRRGAKTVHIVCLEKGDAMTASREEITEGQEEGVLLHDGYSFLRIIGEDKAQGVEIQAVEKFYFDENRKAVLELVEHSQEILPADQVIFAVGQRPEGTEAFGVELTHGSYVKTTEGGKTSREGIFAAGDVVTGTRSVIEAIAAGREAASQMDRYLGGDGDIEEVLLDPETAPAYLGKEAGFGELERLRPALLDPAARVQCFDLVEMPFSCSQSMCEARRCMQCDLRLQISKPRLWNEY